MAVNDALRIKWLKVIDKYRSNLDLATIFYFWQQIDPKFNIEITASETIRAFGLDNVHTVKPRELWGGLLGECKLFNIYDASCLGSKKIKYAGENIALKVLHMIKMATFMLLEKMKIGIFLITNVGRKYILMR